MNNDIKQIQEKLESWAEETVNVYNPIAKTLKMGYYTQTPLSLVSQSPDLLIFGINPGAEGGKNNMTGEELLKGNPCFEGLNKKDIVKAMSEDRDNNKKRNGWALWHRLNNMLEKSSNHKDLLQDFNRFVLSNMIFFGTAKENMIPKIDKDKCAERTLKLIDNLEPKVVILLGKQCRDLFNRITKKEKLEVLVQNSIYHCMYGKSHILAIKHTAYYYSNEEMTVVGKTIGYILDHHDGIINKETISASYIKEDIARFEERLKMIPSKRKVKTDDDPIVKRAKELKQRINRNGTNQWVDKGGTLIHEYFCKGKRKNYIKENGTISVRLSIDNENKKFIISTLSDGNHPKVFRNLICDYCESKGWIKSDRDFSFSKDITNNDDLIVDFMTSLFEKMKTYRETDLKE
jgi:uracil-DNA glycosylase